MPRLPSYALLPCFLILLSLTACESAPPRPYPMAQQTPPPTPVFPYEQLAPTEPPTAPAEMIPDSVDPMNETWRSGHWTYDGHNFLWTPGNFIARPDPTAFWAPDHWEERSYGWAYIPGHWQ